MKKQRPPRPQSSDRRSIRPLSSSEATQDTLSPSTKFQTALLLHQQGFLAEAVSIYHQILLSEPRNFDALQLLGTAAAQIKDFEAAVVLFDLALSISPDHSGSLNNRGKALFELHRYDDVLQSYDKAIIANPYYADAYANRGNALLKLKRFDEAIKNFDQALTVNPYHARSLNNRGNVLLELRRYEDALLSYDQAITVNPDYADAHSNRGNALLELKRYEEAIQSYDHAIAINPDYAEAYSNRGNVYRELKRYEDAIKNYDKAIAINPEYAAAHVNLSLLQLLLGNYDQGLKEYEWRMKGDGVNFPKREFKKSLWLGNEDINNKIILLYSEQGLGDSIQFCRYAKKVSVAGAKVILEVDQSLMSLLAQVDGVSQLVCKGDALPPFDFQCPLLSLPLACKTTLEVIPSPWSYLVSDKAKVLLWAEKLGVKTKPRIGLVWGGNANHKNDHNRSIPLSFLLELPHDYQYISLQKEIGDADQEKLRFFSDILHVGNELHDFTDTAALCELMDIVISVDTSVAHVAGAMGKPVWILLPFDPDWRWLLDRSDSPWYPSATLFRQEKVGEWSGVIQRVSCELERKFMKKTD